MPRRRIRVRGEDRWLTITFAVAAGVGAATAGLSPTGQTVVDWIIVIVSAATVVWAAASAPWWAGAAAASIATALAPTLPLVLIGGATALVALWVGTTRSSIPTARAWVAALVIQVFARLGHVWKFGFSAAVGLGVLSILAILGIARRTTGERKMAKRIATVAAAFAAVAIVGFIVAAMSARPSLDEGQRVARQGLAQIKAGDVGKARISFARAADLLDSAASDLEAPWAFPARLIPALAQNRHAAVQLSTSAAAMARTTSDVLQEVDYDALRVVNGKVDIAAIQALESPLARLDGVLNGFASQVDESRNPWLISPVRDKLERLGADVADQHRTSIDALNIIKVAPALLGAAGPRRYFVAFTTPAEARGLGGFMGNWAELSIENGGLSMSRFGRADDLEKDMPPDTALTGPADFLERFGEYGFRSPNGSVGRQVWHNITMAPDFPTVARVIADLYPKSGGQKVDGVLSLDVYTIARLLKITGPVSVPGRAQPLTADNAAKFLLTGQYSDTKNDRRIDHLEHLAEVTMQKLLSSTLPGPQELVDLLGPMARQERLLAWADNADEESVFERAGLAGQRAVPDGSGLMITFDNGGGNKIDAFLKAAVTYTARGAAVTENRDVEVMVELHNTAPAEGLPDYVIGSVNAMPRGTSRLMVTLYSSAPISGIHTDATTTSTASVSRWHGWYTWAQWVDIPAGQQITLTAATKTSGTKPPTLIMPPASQPLSATYTGYSN